MMKVELAKTENKVGKSFLERCFYLRRYVLSISLKLDFRWRFDYYWILVGKIISNTDHFKNSPYKHYKVIFEAM